MKRFFHIVLLLLLPLCAGARSTSYGGTPFVRIFSAMDYHGHNRNFDIECDTTGRVYVANFEGMMVWDGHTWNMSHTPGISRITSLYKTPGGRVWFGGYNVLGTISQEGRLTYLIRETDSAESFGEVKDIFMSDGRLMLISDEGQYFLHGNLLEKCGSEEYDYRNSSTWRGVEVNRTLVLEDLGLVAKATSSLGVVILDQNGEVAYVIDTTDGLCSNSVTSLSYDGKGSLWGATDNGLFQIILSPVFSHYGSSDGLDGQVTSVLRSVDGRLVVGTLQGLFVLNSNDRFDKVEGLDLACWDLVQTPQGNILAATAQGIFKYSGRLEKLTSGHALSLYMESENTFLAGETDGIYRYWSDGRSEKLNSIHNVAKFVRSEDGGVWAVNYFQETYLMKAGKNEFSPAENSELSLFFEYTDESGRQWFSNSDNKGIRSDALSEAELSWCRALDSYTIEAMDVNEDVSYVGGAFGLVRMDVHKLHSIEPYTSSVYIRSFVKEGFSIGFFASSGKYDPLGENEYSYRLKDDGKWSEWSPNAETYLGTVNIGTYNLTVRCRDAYGTVTCSEPFPFEIEAPWYLKWYALIFYCVFIGVVAGGTAQIRFRKIRRDGERLEKLVDERTRELKEVQGQLIRRERDATVGKLTKGLIDRILNPMNYINNFSHLSLGLTKDLSEDLEDDKDNMTEDVYDDCSDIIDMLKSNLEKIEQHGLATTRILKAMEELLKDHSGKVEECDMLQLCGKCAEMFRNYNKEDVENLGFELKTEFPSDPVIVRANQVNVSKVVMSMLVNSVYAVRKKFQRSQSGESSDKPLIGISLAGREGGSGCEISVFDNGIGIEESILDKIFDPFFTTKPTGEAPGVGLYLCQQVIQDLGGTIRVESRKDEYTRFTIELP